MFIFELQNHTEDAISPQYMIQVLNELTDGNVFTSLENSCTQGRFWTQSDEILNLIFNF